MIGYTQVGNNLSSGVGVDSLAARSPHILYVSNKQDTIRQISIDYLEYFAYTGFRTDVCVYRGGHKMKEYKEMLIKLLDMLTENQIEYIYHLMTKLFGHSPD